MSGDYIVLSRRLCLDIDLFFFFSSRRRHTRLQGDWSSDVCSSDLLGGGAEDVVVPDGTVAARGRSLLRAGRRAKRRGLDDLVVREADVDEAEAASDEIGRASCRERV